MSCVIVHEEMGIYLGHSLGLGFWSKLDAVGQEAACTFENEKDAAVRIRSWVANNDPSEYRFVEVPGATNHATVDQLKEAGLDDYLGEMVVDSAPTP